MLYFFNLFTFCQSNIIRNIIFFGNKHQYPFIKFHYLKYYIRCSSSNKLSIFSNFLKHHHLIILSYKYYLIKILYSSKNH